MLAYLCTCASIFVEGLLCINSDLNVHYNSMDKQTGISIHWNITQYKNEYMLQDKRGHKITLLKERSQTLKREWILYNSIYIQF